MVRSGSGGSRQNVDLVLSQKNLAKNEIFVHYHSNLEILTGFQKPFDPVWIRHQSGQRDREKNFYGQNRRSVAP